MRDKKMLFSCFFLLVMSACWDSTAQDNQQDRQQKAKEVEAQKEQKNQEEDLQETTLQKELKKNLRLHLEDLSKDLQEKNLNDLQIEGNTAFQKHMDIFQGFYGRKDLPKENKTQNTPHLNLQKAYLLQQMQIQKLQQKNEEMGK